MYISSEVIFLFILKKELYFWPQNSFFIIIGRRPSINPKQRMILLEKTAAVFEKSLDDNYIFLTYFSQTGTQDDFKDDIA